MACKKLHEIILPPAAEIMSFPPPLFGSYGVLITDLKRSFCRFHSVIFSCKKIASFDIDRLIKFEF